MNEIERLGKQLEQLQKQLTELSRTINNVIIVQTLQGRDGKIIGEVVTPKHFAPREYSKFQREDWYIGEGMVVLFSNPPERVGDQVYIIQYQLRTSQRTGKNYLKCFKWLTKEQFEELRRQRDQLQQRVEELEEKIKELRKQEKLRKFIEDMKKYGFSKQQAEIVIKLGESQNPDAIAHLLKSVTSAYAVLRSYMRFVVLTETKAFEIRYFWNGEDYIWRVNDVTFPAEGEIDEIYSDTHELFVDDELCESFEAYELAKAIWQKHRIPVFWTYQSSPEYSRLTLVLPKDSELLKKLKVTRELNLPRELKILVYCEILNIDSKKVAEIEKYV